MILSDLEIQENIQSGDIQITPYVPENLESGNYRVTLGNVLLIPKPGMKVSLDSVSTKDLYNRHDLEVSAYTLKPNEFILAETHEQIAVSNKIAGILDGRSSFARLGLTIHQSSQFITPGQDPHVITLELYNAGPFEIELKLGVEIGKIIFLKFDKANQRSYRDYGVYNGQQEATGAIIG